MATLEVARGAKADCSFVLARFSNGQLQHEDGLRFGLLEEHKPATAQGKPARKRKQLVAETSRMTYVGKNYGPQACPETDLARYLVGVYDKKKKKVKIYNSESFLLHPHYPGDDEDKDETDGGKTYMEKVDALTSAFGGARKKRAMESRQRNKMKGDVLDAAMNSAAQLTLQNPAEALESMEQNSAAASSLIPPHDMNATTPQEVYLLSDILSDSDLEALRTPAAELIACTSEQLVEWKKYDKYAAYILSQLSVLPIAPEQRQRKACVISYLHFLILFFKLRASDLKRKDFLPPEVPDVIKKKLLSEYTLEGPAIGGKRPQRYMPAKMKDKLLAYILVVCLILDDFHFEFSALQTDLKISLARLTTTLKALGCKVSNQKISELAGMPGTDVRIATLPIPLTFPDTSKPNRKDRR